MTKRELLDQVPIRMVTRTAEMPPPHPAHVRVLLRCPRCRQRHVGTFARGAFWLQCQGEKQGTPPRPQKGEESWQSSTPL